MDNSQPKKYFLKKENNTSIEFWSNARLPFEPTVELPKVIFHEMRDSLRSAIKGLKSGNGTILNAEYSSTQKGFFDVENVLFYNVGSGVFKHLCNNGLRFERRIVSPPKVPVQLIGQVKHYHNYSIVNNKTKSIYWKKGTNLANWTDIPCNPLKGNVKPHSIWNPMKNGSAVVHNEHPYFSSYGIQVTIKAPIGTKINLASVVKPLLDGIISSFHTHDGSEIFETSERLAKMLGENHEMVHRMLLDSNMNLLGKRKLLYKRSKGVQWNPADDDCMMAEILFDNSMEDGTWSMSGEIFTVELF